MGITDLFPGSDGILSLGPANKTELLDLLAAEAARRLDHRKEDILHALLAREKLGSTALGRGVALPHTQLGWLQEPLAILARLERPINYDARDGEPVDLVFLVLWPEAATEGFLPALSGICRALRDNQLPRQLRQAGSAAEALAKLRAADDRSPDALP
ncbi:PTS sugar transporter subunit IIA [Paeniroseomonas aquatica]|uniref:PTS sugar transporter subunit IIA n=1 Tax=Paeniroseomonas aquatica TaxID=373043 RepID=A0ABT8ACW3_9PROT|nr:PTS sugar transporter subunit IIA [Paeniroseomonas aquatica]MDN3567401.1 PTS sugar transporter subunit IIA [Paeniroseomonas aquatica]